MTHDEHYDLMLQALHQIDLITTVTEFEASDPMSTVYRIAHAASLLCGNAHQDWIDEIGQFKYGNQIVRDAFLAHANWKKGGRQ